MTASPSILRAFTDAAADRVAQAIAGMQREANRERELRDAEHRARIAELDARIASVAELERKVTVRLGELKDGEPGASVTADELAPLVVAEVSRRMSEIPPPKDGEPGKVDPELIAELVSARVAEAVRALPPPKDGADASPEVIAEMVDRAVAALPPPEKGKDADPEAVAALVDEKVRSAVEALPAPARGEQGPAGPAGALPKVNAWEDRVYYEGNVVSFEGALYQASRDTGRAPSHEDWTCIVRAGRDGRSFEIRGTWSEGEEYRALNVVALGGASFAAKRDNPGPCPGDGWQLIAAQGKRGNQGERGLAGRGERGQAGPKIAAMDISRDGLLTLTNEDGSTVECDLYPVLANL